MQLVPRIELTYNESQRSISFHVYFSRASGSAYASIDNCWTGSFRSRRGLEVGMLRCCLPGIKQTVLYARVDVRLAHIDFRLPRCRAYGGVRAFTRHDST